MEHSKEFYETAIRVIDSFGDGAWSIHNEKARMIAGGYWQEIVRMMKGYTEDDNSKYCVIRQRPSLLVVKEDCRNHIKAIEKAEYDRELANREKIENITYGRKAYELAEKTSKWTKGGIIFTSIIALGQIVQWIILIVQWLHKP